MNEHAREQIKIDTVHDEATAREAEGLRPLDRLRCQKCGHRWVRRAETLPVRCPRCQSVRWGEGRPGTDANKSFVAP